jgi:hypothetical protein
MTPLSHHHLGRCSSQCGSNCLPYCPPHGAPTPLRPPAICSSQRGSSQLPTLLRTPTALSLHPAHRMQFPARFKLPPNCPPYGALPPSRPLQTLSGVEGSTVLGSPAGGKDGAAMGTTDGGRDGGERHGVGS